MIAASIAESYGIIKSAMEIKRVSDSSFKIKAKRPANVSVVVSDKGVELVKQNGEIEEKLLFDRPGEYEAGGVGVVGMKMGSSVAYVIHCEEMAVMYMHDFDGDLSEKQLDTIGPIDVLVVPTSQYKVIKTLNPSIVVPFELEGGVKGLVEKMNVTSQTMDKLNMSSDDLPEETQVIVLG